ncbi:MFS general substrate transporter [Lentinus tigrinus ALCF2SS1-7]|uniref:MFS general substrate transporter n=1 Tax=Lentinus tigrinus ALCF2SS1-6 TaxID=1328759 RepID=A0A5C2S026_9APHY|nr:MFS general substrate transporter [Lentinus tigrinus ALCF2SS1-6]RPD71585.1 MFS general substrate transporter [Lentinus tigrinus ALCF2SS1-7]
MGDPEKAKPILTAPSSVEDSFSPTPTSRSSATTVAAVECGPETLEHAYPDGGARAWLTVLGSAAFLICCGQLTAFGVFETWYSEHQLQNLSASTISWIGSIQLWVLYFSGVFLGRIFDVYGPHVILIPGSVILLLSTMITSVCTRFYQFVIVQGLCTGLAYGMLFYPCFASISTHFKKYRATAVGIAIAGSGLGGVVFPIIYRELFVRIGFGWSVRLSGFLMLALCVLGNATVTSRIPPASKRRPLLPKMDTFRDAPFVTFTAGSFLVLFALFIPSTYIANYSLSKGVSPAVSYYIVSAFNAGGICGRILPALLSDAVGRFNITAPSAFLAGVLCLALWTFADSLPVIFVFAVLYGCFTGALLAMQIPCVTQISDIEEVGTRIGVLYSIDSFAVLAGGPAAGAVLDLGHGRYEGMILLCGILHILGSAMILWAKLRVKPNILARV